jgi:hypothetical protein
VHAIERFVQGKYPYQGLCEDAIAITDTHAAIFDGAGGMGEGPAGTSGARFAATTLANAIEELPSDVSFVEAAKHLSAALNERVLESIGDIEPRRRPFAVGVIYSAPRREIWRVGDPHFAIDGSVSLGSLGIGAAPAGFRALYLRLLLLAGDATVSSLVKDDPTRELMTPILERIPILRNSEGSTGWEFGAFDGGPIPERFLEVVHVPEEAAEVVLTSDGYPEPSPSLGEAEGIITGLLEQDPLCIDSFRAEKGLRNDMLSFDDRSYLRLAI